MATEDRGFASMDRDKQREIASKGGRAAHKKGAAHEWTREEAQAAGGLGGAIAELLGEHEPLRLARVGMQDHFGESGDPNELLEHFKLTAPHIAARARKLLKPKTQ